MDPIIKIAKDKDIKVVEDEACGFGSYYKNHHVGTFGDVFVLVYIQENQLQLVKVE